MTQKFYWKKSKRPDSGAFIWFLTQLRQRTPGQQIIIILDNASIHRSRKVKSHLKRYKDIHLLSLPTYSPEYNPVEIFWKWIKPKVYGFTAVGGIEEVVSSKRGMFHRVMVSPAVDHRQLEYVTILLQTDSLAE